MIRRLSLAAAAAVLSYAASSREVRAERFAAEITFVEVQSEVEPRRKVYRQPRQINLAMRDEHHVQERAARRAGLPNERAVTYETVLGARTQVRQTVVHWRFENNNTLVRTAERSSYIQTIRVMFRSSVCTAEIAYTLAPGHRRFQMWRFGSGERIYLDRLSAEEAKCEVREELTS